MKPTIVLAVTDREKNAAIRNARPDMLELRVDLFAKSGVDHAVAQFKERRKLRMPLLLTVRNQTQEGAKKSSPDGKKWEMLQALVPLCDWVDIELSSKLCAKTIVLAHAHKKKVLVSTHDFKGMQANPTALMTKAF